MRRAVKLVADGKANVDKDFRGRGAPTLTVRGKRLPYCCGMPHDFARSALSSLSNHLERDGWLK
jgi:hypothetical protein